MRTRRKTRREPTIALINIVFLMLVFFLVVGTLATPMDRELTLVSTTDLPPEGPPDALVVHADGRLSWRGKAILSVQDYLSALPQEHAIRPRIVPDRAVPAVTLLALGQEMKAAGANTVVIVTERALR